ncbi:DUF6120 family protein [Ruminococcus flavefaciens]|uniref:DUF6120 family protein n=1 Tax=Ruminococcus flavefaciens TaxID=1265 RepID=UPI003F069D71
MKLTNKERNNYISQIKKLLFCSSKDRKKFLKEFNDNIDDFLKDNPEASIDELQKAMGTPQEIADGFLGNADTKAIKKRTSIVRILVLGISIAVIIIAVFFITAWIDMYKNHRGHGEVTIIDNGTIYVEATTSAP